ncbi:hypothetical protein K4K48_002085 [Colletotrichum sp. SAR 10_66]|nr:hypothetical protein K4K48_002085 [Colletotrichum sp. SAR 10_66]
MATDQRPRRREDFRIAVLCALRLEFNAAALAFDEFFDEEGDKFGRARGDTNTYTTGRIGKYNVVMALLPSMGTLALLVGICGGVPSPGTEKEVLLGDVIISKTVVQYDFGRKYPHRFATKDTLSDILGRPNKDIRSLLASLETERNSERLERRTAEILIDIQQTAAQAGRRRTRYPYPGSAHDELFGPHYEHKHRDDADCGCDETWICDTAPDASCVELECDKTHLVLRESLEVKQKLEREGNTAEAQEPHILIGSVGSGNAVMKSGAHRDEIAQRYDLIAFEMEAAGAWDEVPCVVIKGVCDYADSHKNKKWQTFAAATAASSMKALLELYIQTDAPGNSRVEPTTQRINEILTWISKEPYEQHHTLNKSEVLEGTGYWLLKDEVFQSWKKSETSSILWLHGIPGSGKSKLTSIVVENALQSSLAATVYFYCSRNPAEPGRSNPTSIVASIARQLAMPRPGADILDAAAEAYRKFEENAFASQSLTLGESEALIHKLLDSYRGQTITLIIDAMDECDKDTRQDLLDFLVSLLETPTTIKVFVSSRDDRDIVYKLDKYENLCLSSKRNSGDIELFVRSETSRLVKKGSLLRGSTRKEELRDRIIHELISNAHGMFRWASLHIQELCRQATDAAIEERLVKMPRTLEGLYREILAKIETRDAVVDRELARNAFRWLLCAQEQFRSKVFLEMVSRPKGVFITTISRDQLLDLCNNMVIFDENLDAFRFSHLSVREFLEGEDSYRIATAHALAAEQCLLNLADIPSGVIMTLKPMLIYSSSFWADHAKFIDMYGDAVTITNKIVKAAVKNELNGEYVMALLLEEYGEELQITEDIVEAVFDNPYRGRWIMELLLNERRDKIHLTEKFISMAVQSEVDILALVLDKCGDEIDITDEIIEACPCAETIMTIIGKREGYELQVTEKLLIKAAEQVNLQDGVLLRLLLDQRIEEVRLIEDVMCAAARNRNYGFRFITLLIDRCPNDVFITERVLQAAAENHRVMELLLDWRGDYIQITESVVKVALQTHNVMRVLFAARGDRIPIPEDALVFAGLDSWGLETVRTLLEKFGDNIKIVEVAVGVAVSNSRCGYEILEMFLEQYGDDVPFTDEIISLAAGNGGCGDKIMSLLLKKRRDDDLITEEVLLAAAHNGECGHRVMATIFGTPGILYKEDEQLVQAFERSLYEASRLGHRETVEVLLKHNVDANAHGYEFGSALQIAALMGHRRIVQMLLQNHAGVNIWPGLFGYALHTASASGNLKIMRILLQNGADVNAQAGTSNTALQAASRDANVNTQGGQFGNALQVASFEDHQEIALLLLENGADASSDNGVYGGSMQAASAGGHVEMVSLLHRKYSVDLDYSNRQFGRTALSYAAGGGHSSVVELLLADADVRPSSADHMGRTPLFFAAQKGHEDIVLTLAERDPSAVDLKDRLSGLFWSDTSIVG